MLLSAAAILVHALAPAPSVMLHTSVQLPLVRASRIAMEEGVASMEPTAAQKTWFPKAADMAIANKRWVLIDAEGLRLGRMASETAKLLLGKHKSTYTQGADVGDAVIIVNAEKVIVTGKKAEQKLYRRHSGRPGGMKIESYNELQARIPERIVEKAIVGMLPKNSHGRNLFRHLKVQRLIRIPSPKLRTDCLVEEGSESQHIAAFARLFIPTARSLQCCLPMLRCTKDLIIHTRHSSQRLSRLMALLPPLIRSACLAASSHLQDDYPAKQAMRAGSKSEATPITLPSDLPATKPENTST